jgi:HPt (histidine-containing phosphotransfer) domain-containing protein
MTAHALEGDRQKCIAAGMDDYVSKPVKPAELGKVIAKLLARGNQRLSDSPGSLFDAPPVDFDLLYEAIGNDPEELREILHLYLTQMSRNLGELDKAILDGDFGAVELIAHNCAGTSANCGVSAVVAPMRELERMGRDKQLAEASVFAAKARDEFLRARLVLEAELLEAGVKRDQFLNQMTRQ